MPVSRDSRGARPTNVSRGEEKMSPTVPCGWKHQEPGRPSRRSSQHERIAGETGENAQNKKKTPLFEEKKAKKTRRN